jgi:hypothetical protein
MLMEKATLHELEKKKSEDIVPVVPTLRKSMQGENERRRSSRASSAS